MVPDPDDPAIRAWLQQYFEERSKKPTVVVKWKISSQKDDFLLKGIPLDELEGFLEFLRLTGVNSATIE